jgi:uncharacterized membrane protein YphA (DoxX/SURF4 family)
MNMSQPLNNQQVGTSSASLQYRRLTTVTLWAIQAVLALLFLFVGGMKLIMPVEVMVAQMPIKLSGLLLHFIGCCEVAGALGLILPGLTRIGRTLTPLAAWALAVEMLVATGYTLLGGGGAVAFSPLMLGLLCAAVGYSRRSYWAQA